jgi:hypothetical protein
MGHPNLWDFANLLVLQDLWGLPVFRIFDFAWLPLCFGVQGAGG